MRVLLTLKEGLDRLLEWLLIGVFAFLVAVVVWQVFTRNVPWMPPSDGTDELATFLMIWVGLIGASVALRQKAHLGIDYFVAKLPPRGQWMAEIFGYLVVAAFSVLVLLVGGGRVVWHVWNTGQQSPSLEIPMWAVYGAMPVSGFFLTFYSLVLLGETLQRAGAEDASGRKIPPADPGRLE